MVGKSDTLRTVQEIQLRTYYQMAFVQKKNISRIMRDIIFSEFRDKNALTNLTEKAKDNDNKQYNRT